MTNRYNQSGYSADKNTMANIETITTLEVGRNNWSETRVVEESLDNALKPNEVLFKVERLALTANNISYASAGDSLGYWGFFPADAGWGRIPAMGWGEVIATQHAEVSVGERFWGWFPFSTHLKVLAGNVGYSGFSDLSEHRAEFAPVYAGFDRASSNPIYEPAREDQDSLLRGLFMTSWLVDDFIEVNNSFGAESCLITSASSKTSIALAHCVSSRGELKAIGITSPGNVAFCESLGCYQHVTTYDDLASLSASSPVVLVDMAGNANVIGALHHHYGDNMKHSCRIGATHHDQGGAVDGLPGAKPEFFFAPTHVKTRSAELGPEKFMQRIGASLVGFRKFADGWLKIEQSYGADAVGSTYQSVLAGNVDPASGKIICMWPE